MNSSDSEKKFGLSQKSIAIIQDIYSQFPSIKKVLVYGSRAMGNFRDGSDIDMTIIADDNFSTDELYKIKLLFDDSMLPYLVDISDFSKLKNTDLIEHINRNGKILYEKK